MRAPWCLSGLHWLLQVWVKQAGQQQPSLWLEAVVSKVGPNGSYEVTYTEDGRREANVKAR